MKFDLSTSFRNSRYFLISNNNIDLNGESELFPMGVLVDWFLKDMKWDYAEGKLNSYQEKLGINRSVISMEKNLFTGEYGMEMYIPFPKESSAFVEYGIDGIPDNCLSVSFKLKNDGDDENLMIYAPFIENKDSNNISELHYDMIPVEKGEKKGQYLVDNDKVELESYEKTDSGNILRNRYRYMDRLSYTNEDMGKVFNKFCIDIFGQEYNFLDVFPKLAYEFENSITFGMKSGGVLDVCFAGLSLESFIRVVSEYNFLDFAVRLNENGSRLDYRCYDVSFDFEKQGDELRISKVKIYAIV